MKTPMFDIDDLFFFYHHNIGLRHTELALGQSEKENGCKGGDAVSLADYFQKIQKNQGDINKFQTLVENFLLTCCNNFHTSENHYRDVSLSLIDRGWDARTPYDFHIYPLGKCGRAAFPATKILMTVTSEKFEGECPESAILYLLQQLCAEIKAYKINMIQSLLMKVSENPALKPIFEDILAIYANDIYLQTSIYQHLMDLAKTTNDFQLITETQILNLKTLVSQLDKNAKKGNDLLSITIKPFNTNNLSQAELQELLINSIHLQSLPRVKACLEKLQRVSYTREDTNPLEFAARYKSTEILKAVYDFYPGLWQLAQDNPDKKTPLLSAKKYNHPDNIQFLLELEIDPKHCQELETYLITLHKMIHTVQAEYISDFLSKNNEIKTPFDAVKRKLCQAKTKLSKENAKEQNQIIMANFLKETAKEINEILENPSYQHLKNSASPIIRFIQFLWDNLTWLQSLFDRPLSKYEKQCGLIVTQMSIFQKSHPLSGTSEQDVMSVSIS